MKVFRFREKEFWILIASGLILFYRPLLFGETFFFRDLHLHFFPQKLRFVELVRGGEFPIWDPFLHGGQPFLADLNNMALYPVNLIYMILPPVFAFNLDIIFHVLFCAASAYWLARSMGVSPISSIAAGAIYAFCGYSASLTNLLSRLTAMPYLPLMLIALHTFFTNRRPGWFVLCVFFGVLQVFAGAPEMTLLTFLTILGWLLFAEFPVTLFRRLTVYVVLGFLVAGVAAIQIIPTGEMVEQSMRTDHSDYDSFSAWSLNPKRIPEMIFPEFLGYTNRVSKRDYWGGNLESMGFPFILSIYFGWLALSLAVFGSISRTPNKRLRIFLAVLASLAILFSVGRSLPGFQALYHSLPFAAAFRYPIKLMAASVLPISLLAAVGLDEILQDYARKKRIAIYFWSSALLFVLWALVFGFSQDLANRFIQSYFGHGSATAVEAMRRSFTHVALISLASAALYQYWILKPGKLQHAALAAAILFDLIHIASAVNHYAPGDFFSKQPELVQTVKKQIGPGRFYRSPNPPNLVLKLPANDVIYFSRWHLETLHSYAVALYSIPLIYHEDFDNLAKKELVKISDHLIRVSWEQRLPFLTAGGVSVFMTADPLSLPSVQFLATVRNSSNKNFFLYRNNAVHGIAYFVPNARPVSTQEDAFREMNQPGFNPLQTVFILTDKIIPALDPRSCNSSEIRPMETSASRLKFQTKSDCDSYIYFAQPFYDGWVTILDGTETPSLRANYAFSASFVKAGEHTLERVYKPRSVRIGIMVTLVAVLLLVPMSFLAAKFLTS